MNWYSHPLGTKSTSPGRCSSLIVGTPVEDRSAGRVPATDKSSKMSMSSISITCACKVAGRANVLVIDDFDHHVLGDKYLFMYEYITNLSLVGVGVKNLILYSEANLYRNSAVCVSSSRPLSEPSVSAASSGSASIRSIQQPSSAMPTMPRPTASSASSARECSNTSRPSSTSASLRRQHRRWRLLRALGNAGTGSGPVLYRLLFKSSTVV